MERPPLPTHLSGAFTVSEAREVGISRSRLRALDLSTPWTGVRLPAALADDDLARLTALLHVLPAGAAFSHVTAARLARLPLPARLDRAWPCHVTVPSDHHRIRRTDVVTHRADRPCVRHSTGLPVTDLGTTWCDLAADLTTVELVQAGDAIVNRQGWSVAALAASAEAHLGHRGRRTIRAALPLVRPGSGSPKETEVRLLVGEWGLPEPELNAQIRDETGWLARPDLLWRNRRVVAEYYGDVHGPTWKEDLARAALITDAGYAVVIITSHDLRRRQAALRARLEHLLLG